MDPEKKLKRGEFVKKGLFGLGSLVTVPAILQACTTDAPGQTGSSNGTGSTGECAVSPSETKGPFPIKSPADQVKSNIVSDRDGIPMVVNIQVQNQNNNCAPLANAVVDIWHCDAEGNYSEYGGSGMQPTDYTNAHFLRGRQTTDANGNVSFVSIYPGWYRGRAPHIHVEVLDSNKKSLLVTQIAFPEEISKTVYQTEHYNGDADTTNARDNVFSDSVVQNMANMVTGDNTNGYQLTKAIIVKA